MQVIYAWLYPHGENNNTKTDNECDKLTINIPGQNEQKFQGFEFIQSYIDNMLIITTCYS